MSEVRQGKCPTCKIAYRWPGRHSSAGRVRLKQSYCMKCGTRLRATTHLLQWPWVAAKRVSFDVKTGKFFIGE